MVIEPKFEYVAMFKEGLAPVNIGGSWNDEGRFVGGKWGYVDTTGKMVIEPQFDDVWVFSHGLACVFIGSKMGYIDKTGKYVWEPTE